MMMMMIKMSEGVGGNFYFFLFFFEGEFWTLIVEDPDFLLFLAAPSCLSCCSKVVCSELCWFVSARLSVTESQNIKSLNGVLNSLCSQKLVYTIINLL